jgi:hypothetical protein
MKSALSPYIRVALVTLVMLAGPLSPESPRAAESDTTTMELVGAVLNTGPSSAQYGYISFISGIPRIFTQAPQNETTALLTFYNDTTTSRVINHGPLRIVNREGTMTIYLNEKPKSDFGNPASFREGTPVMTATLRHQVILDTVTSQFTTVFVNTIKSSSKFTLDGRQYELGKSGATFETTVLGRPSTSGPGQFVIAGYATGIDGRSSP